MITISIEDHAVKVLEAQGRRVKQAFVQPLEPGLVKEGVVLNPQAVGAAILQSLKEHGIGERSAVVGVSGIHSMYRVTRLPKLSGDLMQEAAQREMARLIPVPMDEIYPSWQIIPSVGDENTVPLLGIPRENIDFVLAALREAGISTRLMDVSPLAAARVVDEPTAIVVNMQPAGYDIVILAAGVAEMLRSLPFVTESSSADDKAAEIKAEMERTVTYYNSSKPAVAISTSTPVFISGPYRAELAAMVGYPVKEVPQLMSYPAEFNAGEYVVNIGLALKAGKGGTAARVDLNTLPQSMQPRPVPVVNVISWAFLLIAAAIVIFMIINVQQVMARNNTMRSEIKLLQTQIEAAAANKPEIDKLQARKASLAGEKAALQESLSIIDQGKGKITADLGDIMGKLPGDMSLTSAAYSAGKWKVAGAAQGAETIVGYAQSLNNSTRFALVQLTSMNEVSFGSWNYSIEITPAP